MNTPSVLETNALISTILTDLMTANAPAVPPVPAPVPPQMPPSPQPIVEPNDQAGVDVAPIEIVLTPLDGALSQAQRGIPQIPLLVRDKKTLLSNWPELATTNLDQMRAWDAELPGRNFASVALSKPGQYWFFEIDSLAVLERIKAETKQKMPKTFCVRSSEGRGHFYFKQTPESIQMENISQADVVGKDWSARVSNEYVVSPLSWHPKSGKQYEVISDSEIVEAPAWLIQWCISQKSQNEKTKKTSDKPGLDNEPISEGARNSKLASIAGHCRQVLRMNLEEIEAFLLSQNERRCQPPLPDGEVRQIAASVGGYEIKEDRVIWKEPAVSAPEAKFAVTPQLMEEVKVQVQAEQAQKDAEYESMEEQAAAVQEELKRQKTVYPKFPNWVMLGTSIYEGLVKPWCDVNSRSPELMFVPAMVMLLNYISNKISVDGKKFIPSVYLVSVGRKGEAIKSSSVESGIRYYIDAGVMDYGGPSRVMEGRSLVWTVGSMEGLGLGMKRSNSTNAVLFYDELKTLVDKAGIQSSSMVSNLCTGYESGQWANTVSVQGKNFGPLPGSYCLSLIACCTDELFKPLWSKLTGGGTGLDDRTFFLLQPEVLPKMTPYVAVNTAPGADKTRGRIDAAIKKSTYAIADSSPLQVVLDLGFTNRQVGRVERFALGFAVDLGKEEIDEDCIERGIALVEYERQVKAYFPTYETETREAAIQAEIKDKLRQMGGAMEKRDLEKNCNASRWGTSAWHQAVAGLTSHGTISRVGEGVPGDPVRYRLMRLD